MALPQPARFCPRCGDALAAPAAGERPACAAGHYTWYPDPKVAVGVVITRLGTDAGAGDAEILLVRRNHEPAFGRWAFPSGYVDAGEVVEDAAAREVLEETGVTVRLDELLGVYSEPGNQVVFVAFAGTAIAGEASPGDEAIEVGYFPAGELPELPFPHDGRVLDAWRAHRDGRRGDAF
jgi:ADP-ribose pyrophosphatase YjhB (NUDIX family)